MAGDRPRCAPALPRRLARPGSPASDRRARRLRQRAAAAAARPPTSCARRQAVHRLQRHHGAPGSITCHHGLVAFHGPMVERRLARGAAATTRVVSARRHARRAGRVSSRPMGSRPAWPARPAGPLVGGTLTQLLASLGTPWAFDPPEGCVLFLEDVGERPYRIHRMLTQLAQAGVLARARRRSCSARCRRCDEPGGDPARDVIRDFVARFHGPVLFGFPSGHTGGPDLDAAVRRARRASSPAAGPRSSSKNRR